MNRDELVAMLPKWFQQIIEYPEIMAAWADALSAFDGNIKALWENQYIQTCDEATISMYEHLLGITPSGTDTLEYRRQMVLNKVAMVAPYTEGYLRTQLDEMFGADGYTLTIDSTTSTGNIVITSPVPRSPNLFFNFWYGIAPAHIKMDAHQEAETEIDGQQYYGGVFVSSVTHYIRDHVNVDRRINSDLRCGAPFSSNTSHYIRNHINESKRASGNYYVGGVISSSITQNI